MSTAFMILTRSVCGKTRVVLRLPKNQALAVCPILKYALAFLAFVSAVCPPCSSKMPPTCRTDPDSPLKRTSDKLRGGYCNLRPSVFPGWTFSRQSCMVCSSRASALVISLPSPKRQVSSAKPISPINPMSLFLVKCPLLWKS